MTKRLDTHGTAIRGFGKLYRLNADEEDLIRFAFKRTSHGQNRLIKARLRTSEALRHCLEMIHMFQEEFITPDIEVFRARLIVAMTDLEEANKLQQYQHHMLRKANPAYCEGRMFVLDTVAGPRMQLYRFNPFVEMLIDLHYGQLSGEAERKANAVLRSYPEHRRTMKSIVQYHERCGASSASEHKKGLINLVKEAARMHYTVYELLGHA